MMDAVTLSALFHEELYLVQDVTRYALGVDARPANNQEKELLQKIVGATGIPVEEIFFGTAFEPGAHCRIWLIFDSSGVNLPKYEWVVKGNTRVIVSDGLGKLEQSVDLKKSLWSLLKDLKPILSH
jgi:hypothetical protein